MNTDRDEVLLRKIRDELDRSTSDLDTLTVARLRAARLRAGAAHSRRPWMLAGGLAGTALAAGLVAVLVLSPAAVPPSTPLDAIDLLVEADPDLVDNHEFYRWVAEHKHAG